MGFDVPVEVTPPGGAAGTGFVGDEIRVCPGDGLVSTVPQTAGLYEFELTATGNPDLSSLPQLVISGMPRNDFTSWLEEHFTAEEIETMASENFEGDFDGDGCPDVCEFVEGKDPKAPDAGPDRGVALGTVAGADDSRSIRLVYFTGEIDGADVVLRSTSDLVHWNGDPSQFRLISRDRQPDGRIRWEWEVAAALGSRQKEFYGHVTVLK